MGRGTLLLGALPPRGEAGQMTPCVFCNILAGRAGASFVYRDVSVAAFMSLEQPNLYKVLVVPNAHVETLYDLTDAQTAELFQVVIKVARAIRLGL